MDKLPATKIRSLTIWQSYLAMYTYWDEFAGLITSDELKNMLGRMRIGTDGVPVNAVMQNKWLEMVTQVMEVNAVTDKCRLTVVTGAYFT